MIVVSSMVFSIFSSGSVIYKAGMDNLKMQDDARRTLSSIEDSIKYAKYAESNIDLTPAKGLNLGAGITPLLYIEPLDPEGTPYVMALQDMGMDKKELCKVYLNADVSHKTSSVTWSVYSREELPYFSLMIEGFNLLEGLNSIVDHIFFPSSKYNSLSDDEIDSIDYSNSSEEIVAYFKAKNSPDFNRCIIASKDGRNKYKIQLNKVVNETIPYAVSHKETVMDNIKSMSVQKLSNSNFLVSINVSAGKKTKVYSSLFTLHDYERGGSYE